MFSRSLSIFLICFDLTRFLVGEIPFGFKSLYGFYWIVICADEALYFLGLLCAEATSRKTYSANLFGNFDPSVYSSSDQKTKHEN